MANTSAVTFTIFSAGGAGTESGRSDVSLPLFQAFGVGGRVTHLPLWIAEGSSGAAGRQHGFVPLWIAYGASHAPVALPLWVASGAQRPLRTSEASLPLWIAAGVGGAAVTLPLWAASGSALQGVLSFSYARVTELPEASGSGHQTSGEALAGSSSLTWPMFYARGEGSVAGLGSSSLTLPMFAATGTGYVTSIGGSELVWPIFLADGTAIQSGVGVQYQSIAMNLKKFRMTNIEGWQINSMAVLGGRIIAAVNDTLVELTGDDDDGEPISASLRTAMSDLDEERAKRMQDVLVSYRTTGDLRITAIVDEHDEHDYVMESEGHAQISPGRVKIGKGLDGRYWQLEIANIDGCDFALGALTAKSETLSRRVR